MCQTEARIDEQWVDGFRAYCDKHFNVLFEDTTGTFDCHMEDKHGWFLSEDAMATHVQEPHSINSQFQNQHVQQMALQLFLIHHKAEMDRHLEVGLPYEAHMPFLELLEADQTIGRAITNSGLEFTEMNGMRASFDCRDGKWYCITAYPTKN